MHNLEKIDKLFERYTTSLLTQKNPQNRTVTRKEIELIILNLSPKYAIPAWLYW